MDNNNTLNQQDNTVPFDYKNVTEENKSIIKVVGVGGGGSNAVENMYKEGAGIQDVSFLIINTDKAALKNSKIPNKLQISEEGLGAGAQPDKAQQFAIESEDAIRAALDDGTKMVFITAGMGGGTGTGASPVVAKIAHELGILTIGIVTIPFQFEGKNKILMALKGVASIRQYVDALLVVNNNRLIDVYPDLNFFNAFKKADDTLTVAAKSISDIINITGYMNLDFADVEKTLKNSGVALISTGEATGEKRVSAAIQNAIKSPLLQDNQITEAKHLLFELCFSESNPVSMEEMAELNAFVESLSSEIEVIWGAMVDNSLGDNVRMIVLASGFEIADDGTIMGSSIKLKKDIEREEEEARLAAQKAEEERIAQEKAEAERIAQEKAEAERIAQEKAEAERIAQEKAEAERIAQEKADAEKKAEEERIAQEKADAEKKAEEERIANEQVVAAQKEAEDIKRQIEDLQRKAAALAAMQAPQPAEQPAQTEPVQPEAPKSESQVQPQTPVVQAAAAQTAVTPTESPLEGIETIRAFYGEETAKGMILNDIRSRYYLLDNKDLTNEELIHMLEHMPAYNRTAEQFAELKSASARGNQGGSAPQSPDGTIHF